MLTLEQITKTYGSLYAADHVDLEIRKDAMEAIAQKAVDVLPGDTPEKILTDLQELLADLPVRISYPVTAPGLAPVSGNSPSREFRPAG